MANRHEPVEYPITVADIQKDIGMIKRHIEAARDEATEIAYLKVLEKWQWKLVAAMAKEKREAS